MQNLKSLLLSGCEGKQKHQMAAEKTRDNESGWEVWSDTKDHMGSAGLCQGSCPCLRAPVLSRGWETGSPELNPRRRWSQSTQPVPHGLCHPGPTQFLALHCAVPFPWLAHPTEPSQEPFASTSLLLTAQNQQGTNLCGVWCAQSRCSGGKGAGAARKGRI